MNWTTIIAVVIALGLLFLIMKKKGGCCGGMKGSCSDQETQSKKENK